MIVSSLLCQTIEPNSIRYTNMCMHAVCERERERVREWKNSTLTFNRVLRVLETKRQLIYPKFEMNEPNEMAHTCKQMHGSMYVCDREAAMH